MGANDKKADFIVYIRADCGAFVLTAAKGLPVFFQTSETTVFVF
jgi:hypothetical protein